MRAIIIPEKGVDPKLTDVPDPEAAATGEDEVLVDVEYSSLNYKDGMALGGNGIAQSWPLIPGIDVVGTVRDPGSSTLRTGDNIVLNGAGAGETRDGGFATVAKLPAGSVVPVPPQLSTHQAAAIGTAGFTAMLCVLALEDAGVTAEDGDVVVTGAAGGVGSLAIALLAGRGFRVVASSGRAESEGDYLRRLGATDVIHRDELSEPSPTEKPVQSTRWAAGVDSVGSTTLANLLAQTSYGGAVSCCGLAAGADLPTTVLPFILRGVSLIGANSVHAPQDQRQRAWTALADEIDQKLLSELTTTVGMSELMSDSGAAQQILAGGVRGRTVVDVHR